MLEWEVKTITSHGKRYKIRVAQAEPGHAYEEYMQEQEQEEDDE